MYHLCSTPEEDGDSLGVVTLFDDQHAILGRSEIDFANQTGLAQLVGAKLLEPGDDAAPCGDGYQLDFGAANPPIKMNSLLEKKKQFRFQSSGWQSTLINIS